MCLYLQENLPRTGIWENTQVKRDISNVKVIHPCYRWNELFQFQSKRDEAQNTGEKGNGTKRGAQRSSTSTFDKKSKLVPYILMRAFPLCLLFLSSTFLWLCKFNLLFLCVLLCCNWWESHSKFLHVQNNKVCPMVRSEFILPSCEPESLDYTSQQTYVCICPVVAFLLHALERIIQTVRVFSMTFGPTIILGWLCPYSVVAGAHNEVWREISTEEYEGNLWLVQEGNLVNKWGAWGKSPSLVRSGREISRCSGRKSQ